MPQDCDTKTQTLLMDDTVHQLYCTSLYYPKCSLDDNLFSSQSECYFRSFYISVWIYYMIFPEKVSKYSTQSVTECIQGPLCATWWRHQMETFSSLLALCAGNSPVPVNSSHKGQWRGVLMFSLICSWIKGWSNNREAGDLRRHRAHYDVIVMRCENRRANRWRQ